MRYSGVILEDIKNGPGLRVSLFVQGCDNHCIGCFNPETWDYETGGAGVWTKGKEDKIVSLTSKSYIDGLSLLGGDPLSIKKNIPGDNSIYDLVKRIKEELPDKNIWCWSGYTMEEMLPDLLQNKEESIYNALMYIDVLVDGRFDLTKKVPYLKWRGSSNQRFIDVQESIKKESVVLCDKYND